MCREKPRGHPRKESLLGGETNLKLNLSKHFRGKNKLLGALEKEIPQSKLAREFNFKFSSE